MASAIPYQLNQPISDDASFEFSCEWEMVNGDPFPWSDYAVEYVLSECGSPRLNLSLGNGIVVDIFTNRITFSHPGPNLRPGQYEHGCRLRHLGLGRVIPVFDGIITIGEGNFR